MTGFTEALDLTTERYLSHFGKTAVALKAICDEAEIPLDASGVNAVAFTTYKATKDAYHAPAPQKASGEPAPAKAAIATEKGRILKLENAGDEAYILLRVAKKVEGNFGPQYEFEGALQPSDENVRLFVGAAAVERQLDFLGIGAADHLEGKTVQFSRAPNPKGKPFWNIAVKGAMKGKKTPSNDFGEAPPPSDDFDLF